MTSVGYAATLCSTAGAIVNSDTPTEGRRSGQATTAGSRALGPKISSAAEQTHDWGSGVLKLVDPDGLLLNGVR